MVVNRKKKSRKLRGSRTHGWGKRHRGAGNRGGRGNAGFGKKCMSKKPSDPHRLGKHGFVPYNSAPEGDAINLRDLDQSIVGLVLENKASESGSIFTIDLSGLGYKKLLSTGKVSRKFRIKINSASSKAVEKVKAAGGEVVVLSAPNATGTKTLKEASEE